LGRAKNRVPREDTVAPLLISREVTSKKNAAAILTPNKSSFYMIKGSLPGKLTELKDVNLEKWFKPKNPPGVQIVK